MLEISLLLKLHRRSGVLAAAVAAVHKAGLTFQSQQAREVEGGPGLLLKAESDVVPEYTNMVSHLELVKGVDCVVEIQVDGEPLLPQTDEPESVSNEVQTDDEPVEGFTGLIDDDPGSPADPEPEPRPDPDPEAMAVVLEQAEIESESNRNEQQLHARTPPEPGTFDHHADEDADRALTAAPDEQSVRADEEQASKRPDPSRDEAPKREMTRAMKRRWRRFR